MMYLSTTNKNETIKSNELVDIINQFREMEGGKAELQHYDFYKKIKKEAETLKQLGLGNDGNFSLVDYVDAKGEKRPCFELTRDGMLQMLNSESVLVRHKTIEYINVLEEKVTKQPIGILESLQSELQSTRQELSELKQIVFANERKKLAKREKKLGISAPVSEKLSLIPDEEILNIIEKSIEEALVEEREKCYVLDIKSVHKLANNVNITKNTLNKKLKIMGIADFDNEGYPYPKLYVKGISKRFYAIKKNY